MRQDTNVVHQPLTRDNLGRPDLVTPVINYLKASFQHWFDSASTTLPAYETAWGGVISKAGANNSWVDFGNGYYNDHHFHYGYFLNIAAVIAKFDSNWLNQHRDYINWFARYICFHFFPSTPFPPLFLLVSKLDYATLTVTQRHHQPVDAGPLLPCRAVPGLVRWTLVGVRHR